MSLKCCSFKFGKEGGRMTEEILSQNESAINQAVNRAMKNLGYPAEVTSTYVLQLAIEAI